ncbi:hypothetical protein [Enterococcus faecium]|uniref:hypothetical protein n=1 Tax=Enterococcus faecium TaxID=1352 RepID=UPI003CE55E58
MLKNSYLKSRKILKIKNKKMNKNVFKYKVICYIICQIKRDKTFHLRNSKKLLMVFGNLVIF